MSRLKSESLNMGELDLENLSLRSWDELYGKSRELIWGSEPVGFLSRYLRTIAEGLGAESRLLDAACGEGRNLPSLAGVPGKIYACDASDQALIKAKSWLSQDQDIQWHLCDLRALPFDDAFFDFTLAADVLQAVPDLSGVLNELARTLHSGGQLLCNIPDLEDGIVDDEMESLPTGGYLYQGRYFFRFMSSLEACEALEKAGFTVLERRHMSWKESPHPGYRGEEHEHTSVVYLARRNRG